MTHDPEEIKSMAKGIREMTPEDRDIFWTELTDKNILDNTRFDKLMDRLEKYLNSQENINIIS
jgi:hypothetical protein